MGLEDKGVIDIITDSDNYVSLIALEHRPWDDLTTQLRELVAKLNSYIEFVVSGQINETEKYRGKGVHILFVCKYRPPDEANDTFEKMKQHLAGLKIGFTVRVHPTTEAATRAGLDES